MVQSGVGNRPKMGLREQHKADKLKRIKAAARAVFLAKGYDAATTREIAELAGVSPGTIFLYARDKGDLVCLMAIDRLKSNFSRAFGACDPQQPLLEQVLSVCEYMFRQTAKNIPLSRIFIKEILSHKGREHVLERVTSQYQRLLVAARERGEIAFEEDPALVARTIHMLYLAEMRHWIMSDDPHPATALRDLRMAFQLLFRALDYKTQPLDGHCQMSAPEEAVVHS